MHKQHSIFLKAILSGIYIAIAGVTYLVVSDMTGSKLIGALLFSLALLVICNRGYYLYTGKIGYLLPYKKGGLKMIGQTLAGNFVGIVIVVLMIFLAGVPNITELAKVAVDHKLDNTWYEIIGLSFFCGILMYTAVDGFYNIKSDFGKNIIVILSVVVFIVAGFEHCIANIAYFMLAKTISLKVVLYFILMVIGNAMGAILINLLHERIKKESSEAVN
ncbi:formate/nitrite transporter family protein [Haploplasma axanthum]|uniref:Formate channel 1 n=1 Tax=Haploplasma axanthum TaxID=29552 RepID=A0A449BCN5_HAPAX|nr:formate/nitrite transporter family protein [Haploplasma axanthum]VEU80204.1 Formate channel 1 [Haploplasma axanthum]